MLNEKQFKPVYTEPESQGGRSYMAMKHIKQMQALDNWGGTVEEMIPRKFHDVKTGSGDTANYPALEEEMSKGPQHADIPPVHVGHAGDVEEQYGAGINSGDKTPMLGNGGHRVAIAHSQGWKMMPVTKSKQESGHGDTTYMKGHAEDYEPSYEGELPSSAYKNRSDYNVPSTKTPTWHSPGHSWQGGRTGGGLYTQLHGAPNNVNKEQFKPEMTGQGKLFNSSAAAGDVTNLFHRAAKINP